MSGKPGHVDPVDHLLLFCADEEYRKAAAVPDFSGVDVDYVVRKFRRNKVSLTLLADVSNQFSTKINLSASELEQDALCRQQWLESLRFVTSAFTERGIGHIFIKVLSQDWAMMSDLDILPSSGLDQLRGLEVLDAEGYDLYQFRLLAYPLKIMAKRKGCEIAVDFYPHPMWMRKKVCDTEIVASRAIRSVYSGVSIAVPSPEDDLYLFGTHGYNHLRFTLAEILHGIGVLKSNSTFNWDYFTSLAFDYGCADACFAYLRLIEQYSTQLHSCSIVNKAIMDDFLSVKLCQKIDRWISKNYADLSFPVCLPPSIASGWSAFYHCGAMLRRESTVDWWNDFFSPFLSWASEIFLGKC